MNSSKNFESFVETPQTFTEKCITFIMLLSVFKINNGIFHNMNILHTTKLSLVCSIIFAIIISFVSIHYFAKIGKLDGVNIYQLSADLISDKFNVTIPTFDH